MMAKQLVPAMEREEERGTHRVTLFVVNIGKSNKILIGGAVHVTCLCATY